MGDSTSATGLRLQPLTAPLDPRAVKAFYRDFAAAHPAVRSPLYGWRMAAAIIGLLAFVVFLFAMGVGLAEELEPGGPPLAGQLGGMAAVTALMLVAGGVFIWSFVRSERRRGTPSRHYRLWWFAQENGMQYLPGPYRATHLTPWAGRGVLTQSRVLRPHSPRFIEIANCELRTGTGRGSTSMGGYVAVRLSTRLPHILLDAVGNDSPLSELTPVPARSQRLSLEGDFDRHFALYCPAGYERDALYLFTPDVMARLVDAVHGLDVEIIDDWLFFVTPRDVVTLDPATWEWITGAVSALTDKIAQWERWRDGRFEQGSEGPHADLLPHAAAPQTVAAPGRRLRGGVPKALLWTAALVGGMALTYAIVSAVVNAVAGG